MNDPAYEIDESIKGFWDRKHKAPPPGDNRSPFYKHGYGVAVNEEKLRAGDPTARTAQELRDAWARITGRKIERND